MPNRKPKISTLWFALLGLIKMQPATGYAIRKIFQETPMAQYSSSPGAIYPALKNLESQELIWSRPGIGKTGREIQTFHCTPKGTKRLFSWLRTEVSTDSVYSELDVVLLRFSYLDLIGDLDWSVEFLQQFGRAADRCAQRVYEMQKTLAPIQPLHGQLALSNGAQVFEANARWARSALRAVQQKRRKQK